MFEFLQVHTNVLHQPAFDSPQFQGLNPYCMGFNICADIKRICEQPTAEDLQWFPTLAHQPWTQILKNAIINHTDTSFIAQYLSPRVIREMRLFSVLQQTNSNDLEVKAIHDEEGYSHIRTVLAQQYHPHHREPHIYIAKVAQGIDKTLELNIDASSTRPLADSAYRVLSYLYRLWGSRVTLSSYDVHGHETLQLSYPSN